MERIIEIPEGIDVNLEGDVLAVRGPKGELKREFRNPGIKTLAEPGRVTFSSESRRRGISAVMGTWAALVRNMIDGVKWGWACRLRLVYSHFPVKLKTEEDKLVIQNFLGERNPRIARLLPGTGARVEKDEVIVTGTDKELVGQSCANIEQACTVKGRDRRVFQDGIWKLGKPVAEKGEKDEETA
jgi:large subunit ribosomal protein L6